MTTSQHRGVVVAKNGIVAASQPLAVSAGLNVLQRGGTFADAAIATSAVLCVVEPYNSHLGGDAFMIVYDAGAGGETFALNGSGAAPMAASLERFGSHMPIRGLAASAVPGLVDAWYALHERWGALPISDLLAPAIAYAEDGFPAGYRYCRAFEANADLLRQSRDLASALLMNGELPQPGRTIRQPDLAWTLRQIASGGRDAFYEGPIAERIVSYSMGHGGLFSRDDFADHHTEVLEPIRVSYRGHTVHGQPPVSQGHILLQELNICSHFDVAGMGFGNPNTIHLQVEAKKLAFADRAACLGDPRFTPVPMDLLLDPDYAAARARLIDPAHAAEIVEPGVEEHDTTYFCVADRSGNAVSFIQSVFWGFGCGVVPTGTGMVMNNRMSGFSLRPGHPNVVAPGKRPAHTLNAYLLTRRVGDEQRLTFVGGTPGGDVQVQSNLQVICNVVDFGMNPQEAVEAPRWQHGGAVGADGETGPSILAIEDRIGEAALTGLQRRGHNVEAMGPWMHSSSYQLVAVHPETGAYLGGSDPRCDGHAAGF
jgi:gamma-glutamyltranspeptidase/glutathione hydrolase